MMKLKNGDDLNYANYLIDNDLLGQRKNMIWFTKYLIREYSNEHNIEINLTFLTNLGVIKEMIRDKSFSLRRVSMKKDVLGDHTQKHPFSNMHEINIYTGDKISKKNQTLEELLFTAFHEIGHAVTAKLMYQQFTNMVMLEKISTYDKKYYGIYKDNCIIKVIGENGYNTVHDYWLEECESNIVGGNILLDVIDANFKDKKNMDKLRRYILERITKARLILYSPEREMLEEVEEQVIKAVLELTKEGTLTVEYNPDGSRKSLSQLFETRKNLKNNLKQQLNYCYMNKDEIKSTSKMNNELLGALIYKAIESYDDEEFIKMLESSTEKEIRIIKDAIKQRQIELRDAIKFATDCTTEETKLKINVTKHLLTKYDNCLRLKRLVKEKKVNTSSHKK